MKIAVTGANGFIGSNLLMFLKEAGYSEIIKITRDDDKTSFNDKLLKADFIFHLAGANRPKNESEFQTGNMELTRSIIETLIANDRNIPIVYSSSIQAENKTPYGKSKQQSEEQILRYAEITNAKIKIFRLPNVFGKWCKPNYNSVVATFCNNLVNDLPITINDESSLIKLCYIDDLCLKFVSLLTEIDDEQFDFVEPVYSVTVGDLANKLKAFKDSKLNLISEKVGSGFTRALYSTYVSYYSTQQFTYSLPKYSDERGDFVEMLKTKDSGQFSYFTAPPGVTRGGHYHHTKTEKFLVVRGKASFKFRHTVTGEFYETIVSGQEGAVVETVPGWSHDITNIGETELIVMLWANEIFNRERPDTFNFKV